MAGDMMKESRVFLNGYPQYPPVPSSILQYPPVPHTVVTASWWWICMNWTQSHSTLLLCISRQLTAPGKLKLVSTIPNCTLTIPYHTWYAYKATPSDTETDSFVSYPYLSPTQHCFVPLGSSLLLESTHSHNWCPNQNPYYTIPYVWYATKPHCPRYCTDSIISNPYLSHTQHCFVPLSSSLLLESSHSHSWCLPYQTLTLTHHILYDIYGMHTEPDPYHTMPYMECISKQYWYCSRQFLSYPYLGHTAGVIHTKPLLYHNIYWMYTIPNSYFTIPYRGMHTNCQFCVIPILRSHSRLLLEPLWTKGAPQWIEICNKSSNWIELKSDQNLLLSLFRLSGAASSNDSALSIPCLLFMYYPSSVFFSITRRSRSDVVSEWGYR